MGSSVAVVAIQIWLGWTRGAACWSIMNMLYHFYGNTTDLYTKALERTPALYGKGQLSMKIL
jgi:hypothetical protein